MFIKKFLKYICLATGIATSISLLLAGENKADYKAAMPKKLTVLSEIAVDYIEKDNSYQIERIDIESGECGEEHVYRYKPTPIYKENKKSQVRNINLINPGEFYLDKDLKKNGKNGLAFGHCSLKFPMGNICYNHEFLYQEEKCHYIKIPGESKPKESKNIKPDLYYLNRPDSATFYPFGGYCDPTSPVEEWQQSYFAVARNNHKFIPETISLILEIIPVPFENEPIIRAKKYSRPVFGNILPGYHYQRLDLKSTGAIIIDGKFCSLSDHPEIWLPHDEIVYSHNFDGITQDIHFDPSKEHPNWALGGFYTKGCELEKIRQAFITFGVQNDRINHNVSHLEDWWKQGLRPPRQLPENWLLENGTAEEIYMSLPCALQSGHAMVSICDGVDSTGEEILKTYHSISAQCHSPTTLLVTYMLGSRKNDQSRKSTTHIDTEINVIKHNDFMRMGFSPHGAGRQKGKLWGRKHAVSFEPAACAQWGTPISQELQTGKAITTLVYQKNEICCTQTYRSYNYRHPSENQSFNYNQLYIHYKPIENTFRFYKSTIPNSIPNNSVPIPNNLSTNPDENLGEIIRPNINSFVDVKKTYKNILRENPNNIQAYLTSVSSSMSDYHHAALNGLQNYCNRNAAAMGTSNPAPLECMTNFTVNHVGVPQHQAPKVAKALHFCIEHIKDDRYRPESRGRNRNNTNATLFHNPGNIPLRGNSPPRIDDTWFEDLKAGALGFVQGLYDARSQLFKGNINPGNLARAGGACVLDAISYAAQEADYLSMGLYGAVGEGLDHIAEAARIGIRRGGRYVCNDQRLAQNMGDYAYLALAAINPFNKAKMPQKLAALAPPPMIVHNLIPSKKYFKEFIRSADPSQYVRPYTDADMTRYLKKTHAEALANREPCGLKIVDFTQIKDIHIPAEYFFNDIKANHLTFLKQPVRDMTSEELIQSLANRAEKINPGAKGPEAGKEKHLYAEKLLKRYQKITGQRSELLVETRYLGRRLWERGDGLKGSIVPDVYDIIAKRAYDYKFGDAKVTPNQRKRYEHQLPEGSDLIQVKPSKDDLKPGQKKPTTNELELSDTKVSTNIEK